MDPHAPPASPRGGRSLFVCLAWVAGAYFAAAQLGLAFRSEPHKLATFWPPNGLLLGLLLLAEARDRLPIAAAAAASCLAANLLGGNTLLVSLGFSLVNVAEPWAVCWLLGSSCKSPVRLEGTGEVFRLCLVILAVAFVAAIPGAAVVVFGLGAPDYPTAFVSFWLSDAMGAVIVTPLVLTWSGFRPAELGRMTPLRAAEGAALLVLVAGLSAAVLADAPGPGGYLTSYTFPLYPVFIWAALRFGLRGATAALLLVSLVAIWSTGHGRGPFARPGVPPATQLLMVQFFLRSLGVSSLALAAALAERRAAQEALRESEARYRQVTETIQEVFWVVSPDLGRVAYVSPACERVWGRPCEALSADPAAFAAAARPPPGPADETYRFVRPDGSARWIRSRSFPVADGRGRVCRVVGISQDVTDAAEAEAAKSELIAELQKALAEIKTLRGMIPICAWCKRLRDDAGFWQTVEDYLRERTEASFTHGMCPGCFGEVSGELSRPD